MTELQWFAFVVLRLLVLALGGVAAWLSRYIP
jgi:hypothetical protein